MRQLSTSRLMLAILIAPSTPALLLAIIFHFHNIGPDRYGLPSYFHAQALAQISFSTVGCTTGMLGIPLYLRFGPRGWTRLRHFAICGMALGLATGSFFPLQYFLFLPARYDDGAPLTWLTPLLWFLSASGIGALVGTLSWLILRPERTTKPA